MSGNEVINFVPPIRKKKVRSVPQIRQTRTSLQRLLIAKPTLLLNQDFPEDIKKTIYPHFRNPTNKIGNNKKIEPRLIPNKAILINNKVNTSFKRAPSLLLRRSNSFNNISIINSDENHNNHNNNNNNNNNYLPSSTQFFSTPNKPLRKSKSFRFETPIGLMKCSTPVPPNFLKLQHQLNNWLRIHGKPTALFHHLKLFGFTQETLDNDVDDDNNKENTINIDTNLLPSETNENNNNNNNNNNLQIYAKEALTELRQLIEENYSIQHCRNWLELIKKKDEKITEYPEYWECKAAIDQSTGNFPNAIEHYKKAIIQGAQVPQVEKLLENLLEKFSVLQINSNETGSSNQNKNDNNKLVLETRNIFKSTIIQFAVSERNSRQQKKNGDNKILNVIPVRRSTRKSRSGFINTSGIQLCDSIRDLDVDQIHFQSNAALC